MRERHHSIGTCLAGVALCNSPVSGRDGLRLSGAPPSPACRTLPGPPLDVAFCVLFFFLCVLHGLRRCHHRTWAAPRTPANSECQCASVRPTYGDLPKNTPPPRAAPPPPLPAACAVGLAVVRDFHPAKLVCGCTYAVRVSTQFCRVFWSISCGFLPISWCLSVSFFSGRISVCACSHVLACLTFAPLVVFVPSMGCAVLFAHSMPSSPHNGPHLKCGTKGTSCSVCVCAFFESWRAPRRQRWMTLL